MSGPTIHGLTATLVTGSVALSPKSLQITMDESWSPYIQGTLVCSIPLGSWAGRASSKPQNGARVSLTLTRVDADGGSPQSLTLNLGIRRRRIDYKESTVTFELASDEALLQDYANFGTSPDPSSTSLNQMCVDVLTTALGPYTLDTTDSTNPTITSGLWHPGVKAWDHLNPSLQKANHRLWSTGNNAFFLAALPLTVAGSITLDKPVRADEIDSRDGDDWADACLITYRYTNGSGVVVTSYDSAWTPANPADVTKTLALSYDNTKSPGTGAAAAILARMGARSVSIPYQAVSDLTARPGMTATMTLPGQSPASKVLRSVSWAWPGNTMTVTTRET